MTKPVPDNITELLNQLRALHHGLARADVGYSKLDKNGRYNYADKIYAENLGYDPKALAGLAWDQTVAREDRMLARYCYSEMLSEGKSECICRAVRKDGTAFLKKMILVKSFDGQGTFDGHFCFMTNIDKQKLAEDELRKARDEALKLAGAKSSFLANMSHEIRTPMNGVIGMINLMMETSLNQEQLEFATTIKASAESLLSLINDILDFSKIEAGKMVLQREKFACRSWFNSILKIMDIHCRKKQQELVGYFDPRVPAMLSSDHFRLRQVLINLISNASKFTPEGGGVIVRADLTDLAGGKAAVQFTVSDTGIGIDPKYHESVFQPFVQGDSSTSRNFGGTGLGLSICTSLVKLMGGKIWLKSSEGIGTTFFVSIPMDYDEAEDWANLKLSQVRESLNEVRVLRISGQPEESDPVPAILNHWGLVHSVASSLSEASRLCREARQSGSEFSLFLIDASRKGGQRETDIRKFCLKENTPAILTGTKKQDGPSQHALIEYLSNPGHSSLLDAMLRVLESKLYKQFKEDKIIYSQREETGAESDGRCDIKVLLVEDNVINQKVALKMLEKKVVQSKAVDSAVEALNLLEKERFDLILMDIQMPQMSGEEATRLIRASNKPYSRIPIVALTANAMKGDKEKYLENGMDGYISKPIDKAELYAILDRFK